MTDSHIYEMGYLKAINFKDEVAYYNAPVYVRFNDMSAKDPRAMDPPILINSSNLYSFYCSETTKRFMDGMTRISFAPIDTKMLVMVVAIAIGIAIGMAYFLM